MVEPRMQSRAIAILQVRWRPAVTCIAFAICLLLQSLSLNQWAFAQTSSTGETTIPLITEGQIQSNHLIWVITKDNKPIQMNITLQQLQRLMDATSLAVHLSNASLELQIAENVVDVQARFNIESPGEGVVRRFDLRLDNCQLIEPPGFSSEGNVDGSQTVESQLIPTKEGYRWLHLSSQAGKHTASLKAKSLVSENSDRRNVAIELPLVTTALDVHLPPNSVEERVRNEDLIESRTVDEKGVHLKIRSRGGSFTLGWRQSTVQAQVAAVEAKCDTLFEPVDLLDPAQFWSATSTVTIRWNGNQANNKVQIVLPSGGQWSSSLQNPKLESFRLTHLMPTDPNSAEILEIENLDPTELPPVENLKLQWRWLPQDQKVDRFSARLKLPTPQVIGADTTEGNIELIFPSSFQALFEEGNGVRFIRQIQTSSLADRLLFQYKGQSASLALTFRKEQFQPIIRPTYRVHAFDDKLELTAWFKCTFDGTNTEVGLIPGQWTIDEDSVCRVMDEDIPDGQESQPLSIQKLEDGSFIFSSRSQEVDNEQDRIEQLWRFVGWRSLNPADGAIQFQLPTFDRGRPIGQKIIEHGSGTLLLSSQNYQLLQSEESGLVGLLPDSYSTDYSGYTQPQLRQPSVFRFKRQGAIPAWKGQVRQLPRQVRYEQRAEIEVQSGRAQIKQDYKIHVSNRSLRELAFSIHESVTPLVATADGFTLTLVQDQRDSSSPWRTYQVAGLPELLGDVKLSLSTSIPWKLIDQGSSVNASPITTLDVPLARIVADPNQISVIDRWSIIPSANYEVRSLEQSTKAEDGSYELNAEKSSIKLAVQAKTQSQVAGVVTSGTWLQTMLNGEVRRDRFVARVRSQSKQVFVQMPSRAQLDRVALDGQQLSSEAIPYDFSTRQATISLPDDQEHTVEVLYNLIEPLNSSFVTTIQIDSAMVVNARSIERSYWQLITPDVFHLGWCPKGLTAEWRWRWSLISWNRVSDDDQVSLEQLLSAAILARPPASTNSYVMSGYDVPPQVEVFLFSRFVLWLPVGALTIAITVLLLNVPFFRSPSFLVLSGVALAALALVWPDFSILLGQTTVASIGLVVLIWTTQAAVQSRVRRRSVFSTRSVTDISDQHHSATRASRSQVSAPNPSPASTE